MISCFLFLGIARSAASLTPVEIAQLALESSLQIKTETGQASGFYIAPNIVVTNSHVVAGGVMEIQNLKDGQKGRATSILYDSPEADIALMKVTLLGKSLPVSTSFTPKIGSKVYTVGNPLGYLGSFSDGLLSAIRQVGTHQEFQHNASTAPGSSGSAILDENGEVVAVVSSGYRGTQVNFSVSALSIWAGLDQLFVANPTAGNELVHVWPNFPSTCSASLELVPLEERWTLLPVRPVTDTLKQGWPVWTAEHNSEYGSYHVEVSSRRLNPKLMEVLSVNDYLHVNQQRINGSTGRGVQSNPATESLVYNTVTRYPEKNRFEWDWHFFASRFCEVEVNVRYSGADSNPESAPLLLELFFAVKDTMLKQYPNSKNLFAAKSNLPQALIYLNEEDSAIDPQTILAANSAALAAPVQNDVVINEKKSSWFQPSEDGVRRDVAANVEPEPTVGRFVLLITMLILSVGFPIYFLRRAPNKNKSPNFKL